MASVACQVMESNRMYIDQLYSSDGEICYKALTQLKNAVIGSNRQKTTVIEMGIVPRLISILMDEKSSAEVLIETAVILGSLAKGTDKHIECLIDSAVVPVLLNGLSHSCAKYVEACLRCLKTTYSSQFAPVDLFYQNQTVIPHLMRIISQSACTQECVSTILANCCRTPEHQNILCSNGIVRALAALLASNIYKVQIPSLECLAQVCYKNEKVSSTAVTCSYDGKSIPDILVDLLARDRPPNMQLAASKCLTYIHRAGAVSADDPRIAYKTLPCLVRMCKKDRLSSERIAGAETLAYLIEVDTELQRIASISDLLIASLTSFLNYEAEKKLSALQTNNVSSNQIAKFEQEMKNAPELRQAAFKAFASLGANDEDIRKKIIETDNFMDHIVNGISDVNPKVRIAAVRCLHSLSRSVQQLRTTFQDHTVWKPLMQLLIGAQDDILVVASSTMCNLLLEFSPSKEPILESGAIEILCSLTCRPHPALRLNGIWALMNMAFQSEQKIKSQILNTLGTDHIFRLLSDTDINVLMKTLGLLRNLLANKAHIDHLMGLHGKQIMQAVVLILEGEYVPEVKEQALCILANVADGETAKNFIMTNEDVLKKLVTYMMHSNINLQSAATFCISNLVWKTDEGASERQMKLRELGVQKILQQMLTTTDTTLFDKVKTAMHQFN
ncbi:Armadillo repeat-containing protein 8 [Chamberlinius hualienensis]